MRTTMGTRPTPPFPSPSEYGGVEWRTPAARAPRTERAAGRAQWAAILRRDAAWSADPDAWRALRFPPFPPPAGVPARALARLVRIVAGEAARRGGEESWRQGWDSRGHWGIGPGEMASILSACRGRINAATEARARALVRHVLGHPGLGVPRGLARLPRVAPALRASARASARSVWIDARALYRLGALEPELQRAALDGASGRAFARVIARGTDPDRAGSRAVVRVRDLDWTAVARAAAMARGGGPRVRVALAGVTERGEWSRLARHIAAREALYLDGGDRGYGPVPAYRRVSDPSTARALILGIAPSEIAAAHATGAAQLTRAEAHRWLTDAPDLTPAEWLRGQLPPGLTLRDERVVRWALELHRAGRWSTLTRTRTTRGPAGAEVAYRYVDRIDEVMPDDVHDLRETADAVFARAAERAGAEWLARAERDHRVLRAVDPALARAESSRVRVLRTPAELVAEGRELHHCVGGYADAVERGSCVILSIRVGAHRSTVELDRASVVQHRAAYNRDPHPACERVLDSFLRRMRRGGGMRDVA